jgi:hypothetical protein
MRKNLFLTALVSVLLIGGLVLAENITYTVNPSTEKLVEKDLEEPSKIVSSHGKTDGFDSLSELEKGSPIIVRGIKTGKLKSEVYKSKARGNIIGGYTESEFTILEVFKNEKENKKIGVNKKISVGERSVEHEGTIYTVNGYKEMEEGKEYLLFLVEEEGLFAPRAVTFGKVPLDSNELEIYFEGSMKDKAKKELYNTIFNNAREKFKK